MFAVLLTVQGAFAAEQARWTFADGLSGWGSAHQAELSNVGGHLKIVSTGNDPNLSVAVNAPAGWHRISLTAKYKGRADVQVFWSTTAEPGTSEKNSVRGELRSTAETAGTINLYFFTDSPLTGIRLDPFSRKGQMHVESIVLTDDAPPEPQATPVADIKVPEGFRVELLHSVRAESHGSWVSMTSDDKGRLIVSDQYGKLHRVLVPALGTSGKVLIETIDVEVGMAQGLLYAFDSLYVMVNGTDKDKQGLYRVTDSDGDDKLDHVEWLRKIDGGGEHGPHSIILSPDGQSLYVCAGNHTDPVNFEQSRVPRIWAEDQLLPRMWDAGGHAVGKMAPGGWVAKVSPDGKQWELVASGFRNEFDIAFSPEGELFTYDADMEWDVGTPWYRPTRVNHVTSGAEFGWRSGTGKWPTWYPDSLPSVLDIGPGSPTGIVFGTGATFPEKYQRALFISDWSYGVIYAVHLTPDGATWKGEAEPFASAAPLPVTDLVVSKDGALYFTIGGRKTQSGLYRVTYTGAEQTAAFASPKREGEQLRTLRRELESLHHAGAQDAVEKAWPYLGHPDRFIRFAARTAIEHQPVNDWYGRAIAENSSPDAKITALLALARTGDPSMQDGLLGAMAGLAGQPLSEDQNLAALRVLGLTFIRMGEPSPELAQEVAAALREYFPSESVRVNRELCALLVYLNDSSVAEKTVALMKSASTQEEQLHYALCLRVLKAGWTPELRTAYFNWFLDAAGMRGGNSFSGFLKNIRDEAVAALPEADAAALKDLLAKSPAAAEPTIEAASRPLVKEWTVADLVGDVQAGLGGRDLTSGRRMFTMAGCYKCHRFAGKGGIVGPDITGVGRRFNAQNLLESIIEPSKVISDQYESTVFVTDSGKQIIGRVVNLNGDRLMVSENMLDPGRLTTVQRDEIEEMFTSKVSMMPAGLLNNLTKDEILDLIAWLQSGGNPQ
ncbi:MAG: c-type cytochrome [Planctomycetaceae bacterium]|nr:c-type cytochrome [Planctomycetaceae bacterium]